MLRVILDQTHWGNRGFFMEFPNGNSLSIMFGIHHMCSNNSVAEPKLDRQIENNMWQCEDAEVLITIDGLPCFIEQFDPISRVTPMLLARFIDICSRHVGALCHTMIIDAWTVHWDQLLRESMEEDND